MELHKLPSICYHANADNFVICLFLYRVLQLQTCNAAALHSDSICVSTSVRLSHAGIVPTAW